MIDFYDELEQLRESGGEFDDKFLKNILKKFEPKQNQIIAMKKRYRTTSDGVPVFSRSFKDSSKVNNRVNNDFFSEIVDIKTGYFAGNPFSYQFDKNKGEEAYERAMARLEQFTILNNVADLDSESTKNAAIGGYDARLLYVEEGSGAERVTNIPAEEALILGESITAPEFAFRIIPAVGKNRRIEFYDSAGCTVYYEKKRGVFDVLQDEGFYHPFEVCPLFGIPNDEELIGDAEKVLPLIDAYDRTISDVNSEIESFRLAYMLFEGGIIDEETLREAQRTGAFSVPEGGKIEYLVKNMSDTIVENHLNRLEQNIYKFSKTPNLSGDDAFAGNQSGVALKFKLFPLEAKCKTFERKLNTALMYQFRALCNSWRKRGDILDPLGFFVEYKRNFPLDLLYEAQVQAGLKGLVSEHTRLAQASFIDDVDYELELMEEESLNSIYPDISLDDQESSQPQGEEAAEPGSDENLSFVTE